MRRAPTSKPASPPVVAGDGDFDAELGVWTLYFDIPRSEAAYFRVIVESWEDLALIRTMRREYMPATAPAGEMRSLVVAMVVPDFLDAALRSLGRLGADVGAVQVPTTPAMRDKLRSDLAGTEAG